MDETMSRAEDFAELRRWLKRPPGPAYVSKGPSDRYEPCPICGSRIGMVRGIEQDTGIKVKIDQMCWTCTQAWHRWQRHDGYRHRWWERHEAGESYVAIARELYGPGGSGPSIMREARKIQRDHARGLCTKTYHDQSAPTASSSTDTRT